MDYIRFSKGTWQIFGNTIFKRIFKPSIIMHFFNSKLRRVLVAGGYYKKEQPELMQVIQKYSLQKDTKKKTAYSIMEWVNKTYPASKYYKNDKQETWSTPMETLNAFEIGVKGKAGIDCDDYAILIYSLCRVAGLTEDDIYLCFNKAENEGYHLNCMFFDYEDCTPNGKVPYVLEGTYRPNLAMRSFNKVPYDGVTYKGKYVYTEVRYIFNDKYCYKNRIY